jgi:hypothetical protein
MALATPNTPITMTQRSTSPRSTELSCAAIAGGISAGKSSSGGGVSGMVGQDYDAQSATQLQMTSRRREWKLALPDPGATPRGQFFSASGLRTQSDGSIG